VAWVLVIVRVTIVELIPGPLLGVVWNIRGALDFFLDLMAVLLLELKVPIRADAGAHVIEGALIPNNIGPANLLGRLLTVIIVVLKVPRHYMR